MPETEVKKTKVNKRMDSAIRPVEYSVPAEEISRPKHSHGRPTDFTEEIADNICSRITNGESLSSITRDEDMPHPATVYRWLQKHSSFCEMYTRAREDQADTLADQIIAISEEKPMLRIISDSETIEKLDPTGVSHNRNRIDARKWIAAKLKPRKYGERQILAGDAENPLEIKQQSETLDALLVNLQLVRQTGKQR
jgi:hypothetical protein